MRDFGRFPPRLLFLFLFLNGSECTDGGGGVVVLVVVVVVVVVVIWCWSAGAAGGGYLPPLKSDS